MYIVSGHNPKGTQNGYFGEFRQKMRKRLRVSYEISHGYSFIYFIVGTCGEFGRVLAMCYRSFSCRLLVYVLWMSLILHGFTSFRCFEWIGYRFDIIFCTGSFLVYM